jgi:predicted TIM-barrel fold metal-dependent hydrolase
MKAPREYRLISADGHLNGPGDIWTSRVSKKYRDQVPRIERVAEGDAWVCEGYEPRGFGWEACAGRAPDQMGEWCTYDEIHPGGYDPHARLRELDVDGIDAELLFPMGFAGGYVRGTKDSDLHHEMIRAYNDFLSEFCAVAPDRLVGAAMVPSQGVDQALQEIKRCSDLPGLGAWLLGCYPHGDTVISPDDDPVWAAISESEKPITIHIGLTDSLPTTKIPVKSLPGTGHFYDAPRRMLEWIFSGVLDRFPDLQIILAEVDCGWMPYFAEQADDNYLRHSLSDLRDVKLRLRPSEYMAQYFFPTFITDHYAIANRHRIGVDRMMWSNDYPHITSDWPYSWKTINASFAGVPADEAHAILAGNAQRLLRLGT